MSRFGACILSCDGPKLTPDEKALFREIRPFGFILFARHVETPEQVQALCDEMRDAAGHNALITVDQEGGRVQRFGAPHWRAWRPALEHADAAFDPARALYLRARLIAHELHSIGLDSNCVPNLDLATDDTHAFLKNRCLGRTPQEVGARGRAMAVGMLDGGIVPVMKHMPGHGRAQTDSHKGLPIVETPEVELDKTDFAPFRALQDLPMAMTNHVVYKKIDDRPTTLSPIMIRLIRRQLSYDGLILTDDISMGALSGSLAERSRKAVEAGCDVVVHCNDTFADRVSVAEAAGEMSRASHLRAETALAARKTPDEIDIPALEAELRGLTHGRVYV